MHLAVHTRRLRRGAAYLGLLAFLGAAAVTLSQCKMVDERLTGVEITGSKPANCYSQCAQAGADSVQAESQRHVAKVQSCAGDPVCLAMEEMFHEHRILMINQWRKACQERCHHQGSGSGR